MMDVRPINTEADYNWALSAIEPYFEHEPDLGTPEGDRFDVLSTLIHVYEAKHYPIPKADPISILNFAIEDMGRSQAELATLLGSKSRASEVLNRRRPLTLEMIRAISAAWKIPEGCLTGAYLLVKDTSGKRPRRQAAGRRTKEREAA